MANIQYCVFIYVFLWQFTIMRSEANTKSHQIQIARHTKYKQMIQIRQTMQTKLIK